MTQDKPTTIGPSVISALRRRYEQRWSRPWPYDDAYLSGLVMEAKELNGFPPNHKSKTDYPKIYDDALDLMRETHEFDPNEESASG